MCKCDNGDLGRIVTPARVLMLLPQDAAGAIQWSVLDLSGPALVTFENVDASGWVSGSVYAVRSPHEWANASKVGLRASPDLYLPCSGRWYIGYAAASGSENLNAYVMPDPTGVLGRTARIGLIRKGVITQPAINGGTPTLILAANPRRRFVYIRNGHSTATIMLGWDNTLTTGNGWVVPCCASSSAANPFGVTIGPGGDLPLYNGDIYAVESGGDATPSVHEFSD